MPELSITEPQHDRLEVVRREVEAAYVETYGQTRPQDAIEYLLDTYTPPEKREVLAAYEELATAAYPTLQRVASDVEEVPGSGIEAAEMRGRLLAALGPETLADRLRAADTETTEEEVSTTAGSASDATSDSDSSSTISTGPPVDEDSAVTTDKSAETTPNTGEGAEASPAEDLRAETSASVSGPADSEREASEPVDQTDREGADESTVGPNDGDGSASGQAGSLSDSPLASVNKLLDDHSEKWRKGEGDAPYEVDLPDGTTKSARTKDDVRQLLFRHY